MNEIEQVFNAAGDAGAVIVLAICAYLIIRVVMSSTVKMFEIWRDAAKERNAIDEQRNAIDKKRNEVDEKVADTLVIVSDHLAGLNTTSGETSTKITLVHDDVKTIPAEVWRLGDPKLDAMKTGIENRIEKMQGDIEKRLPTDATNAREAVRLEFEEINNRLDDLAKTLRTFSTKQNTKNPASVVGYMGKPPKDIEEI